MGRLSQDVRADESSLCDNWGDWRLTLFIGTTLYTNVMFSIISRWTVSAVKRDVWFVLCVQCSYSVCLKKREDNSRAVEEFAEQWRARGRETFQCYYDTADTGRVIVEKMYSIHDVVHSMTWPSLVVVVCALAFLRIQTRRHKLTLCGRRSRSASLALTGDVTKQALRQQQQQQQHQHPHAECQRGSDDGGDQQATCSRNVTDATTRIASSSAVAADDDDDDDDDPASLPHPVVSTSSTHLRYQIRLPA